MRTIVFLFSILAFTASCFGQPLPILRNAMTTNVAGTPVISRADLSITNYNSGTNWLFYGASAKTVARLGDISASVTGKEIDVYPQTTSHLFAITNLSLVTLYTTGLVAKVNDYATNFAAVAGDFDLIGFRVYGVPFQVENLTDWKNSDGETLAFVDAAGNFSASGYYLASAGDFYASNLFANQYIATDVNKKMVSTYNGISWTNLNLTLATNEVARVAAELTNYVNSLVAGGTHFWFYGSSNAAGMAVGTVGFTNWALADPSPRVEVTNTVVITGNDQYLNAYVSTQLFDRVTSGAAEVEIYTFENTAGSSDMHAEFYVLDTVTGDLTELGSTIPQAIPAGAVPQKLTFTVAVPDFGPTNLLRAVVRFKTSGVLVGPTASFVTEGLYASHMTLGIPSDHSHDAFLPKDNGIATSLTSTGLTVRSSQFNAVPESVYGWHNQSVDLMKFYTGATQVASVDRHGSFIGTGGGFGYLDVGGAITAIGSTNFFGNSVKFGGQVYGTNAPSANLTLLTDGPNVFWGNSPNITNHTDGVSNALRWSTQFGTQTGTNLATNTFGIIGPTENQVIKYAAGGYWTNAADATGAGGGGSNYVENYGYSVIATNLRVSGVQTNWAPQSGLQFVISTNAADGVPVVPPFIVTNGYVGVRIANPTSPLHVNGNITASSGAISAGNQITCGSASGYFFGTRTIMLAPADGSFQVRDGSVQKDRLWINGTAKVLTEETATPLFYIATAGGGAQGAGTNVFCGGVIDYTIFATDNTYGEVRSGAVTYEAVNPSGVWTNQIVEIGNSASTLSAAWTMSPKTGNESTNIVVNVNANATLTPAANKIYIFWQLRQNSTNSITVL